MCGICGIVGAESRNPETRDTLEKMTRVMKHRGPDAEGFYLDEFVALGHVRLSIIDVEHGCEPMPNEDETVWIVLNGEIYNYIELRRELVAKGHIFRTRSDTEVVLHSYEEYGEACVDDFNGMFAFAIWDKPRRKLLLARDRVGIKPLYYTRQGGQFLFASEIKGLLENQICKRRADMGSVAEYMVRSYVTGERTFLVDVRKLEPGHLLVYQDGSLKKSKYWDVSFAGEDKGESHYVEKLAWLISDSVRLQLRSDVPLGAYLSGGIDSSTVVCAATKLLSRPLKTFSGAFAEGPRYDERKYIAVVEKACKTDHHEIVPTMDEFFERLPLLIWFLDEPVVGAGVFPQYAVSALAGKHVKVILGGQGGDELFAGYTKYYRPYFTDRIADFARLRFGRSSPATIIPDFLMFLRNRGTTDIPAFLRKLSAPSPHSVLSPKMRRLATELPLPVLPEGLGSLDLMLYVDLKEYLQSLLHVEDRASMAASIESRVPILDHRIVELAASVPYKYKMRHGLTKHLLRRAATGSVPDVILSRRDKKGFPTPIDVWFSRRSRAILNLLDSPGVEERGILDRKGAVEIVSDHVRGKRDNSFLIWKMINVELWYSLFIEGKRVQDIDSFKDS
ncbi:MAG: asparagine synthase (glutamine-hydrolyzing) [Candidatus Eisenbacteria bacterium]|nr:asparagine synthase (glutamine-hydrolyzing) [Candidatus Eisenbacteria bacterium]